jgi:predicted dehydrogenase
MIHVRQAWPVPSHPRPIVVIGAGSIVNDAHLPAYRRLQLPVRGIYDLRADAARAAAARFGVARVFSSLAEAAAANGVVFDVAVPGDQILKVLDCLPPGAPVLIQKPMGENLAAARAILNLCHTRHLVAAINFQLRFSPNVLALKDLVDAGELGDLTDIEVRVVDRQPWEQWSFLKGAARLEILYHSIHYLDAIRLLAGEPGGVHCRAIAHPDFQGFPDVRSTIILDYGDRIRCSLTLNHAHAQDGTHRASFFKVEGRKGAALATMGVNLDYPTGSPDTLEVATGAGGTWTSIALRGSWFPHAFEGPMSNLQRFIAGEDRSLVSPVADAIKTMALVEACYCSSRDGSTPIPDAEGESSRDGGARV